MKKTSMLSLILIFCFIICPFYSDSKAVNYEEYDKALGEIDCDYEVLSEELARRDELEVNLNISKQLKNISDEKIEKFIEFFNKHSDISLLSYEKKGNIINADFKQKIKRNITNQRYTSNKLQLRNCYDELKMITNDLANIKQAYSINIDEKTLKNVKFGENVSDNSIDKITFDRLMEISGTEAIRKWFRAKHYTVSLAFFNHSLLDNPSNLRYQTEAERSDPVVIGIKKGLYENDFVEQVARFGYENDDESNMAGDYIKNNYFSEFNVGDLRFAIHGLHNIRFHRMYYGKTYFRLYDVYDFDRYLSALLDLITSGTSPYDIIIEGLVLYDNLQ